MMPYLQDVSLDRQTRCENGFLSICVGICHEQEPRLTIGQEQHERSVVQFSVQVVRIEYLKRKFTERKSIKPLCFFILGSCV
jgi:hypothetical protein